MFLEENSTENNFVPNRSNPLVTSGAVHLRSYISACATSKLRSGDELLATVLDLTSVSIAMS